MISRNQLDFTKAVADETRQKIMGVCCCDWVSVNNIVDIVNVSQPTVSHHLSVLKDAGIVKSRRVGKQVFYTLDQQSIAEACCGLASDFAPDKKVIIINRLPRE